LNPAQPTDSMDARSTEESASTRREVTILASVIFAIAVAAQVLEGFSPIAAVIAVAAGLAMIAAQLRPRSAPASTPPQAPTSVTPGTDIVREATIEASLDCVISLDAQGIVQEWNGAARNTFGYRPEDAVGRSLGELIVPPALRDRFDRMVAGMDGSLDSPFLDRPVEIMAMHASGSEFPVEASVSLVRHDPPLFTGFVRDISGRRHQEHQNAQLQSLVRSSQDAIVRLDLREVVTSWSDGAEILYGYTSEEAIGKVLGALTGAPETPTESGRLVNCVLNNDCSAFEVRRIRKDEQAIVVSELAFPIRDLQGEIVGVAAIAHDVTEQRAREERERHDTEGRLWRGRVEEALAKDNFVFWGQPVVAMETGLIHHHELLLRMDFNGELISPGKFLPHVEGTDLISEIDRWALRRGIEYAQSLPVAIKLSDLGLTNSEVTEIVREQLTGGAPPQNVILEITESAAAGDLDAVQLLICELAELGCEVTLDDFGTGYGSFTYLKKLPVTQLKIDMQFVRNLVNDEADQRVVRSMIEVAKNFDLTTIAEGVEDEQTLQLLRKFGVELVQGYHVGYPARMTAAGTGAALISGNPAGPAHVPTFVVDTP
jgi:PAS domain S-box-containing protein